MEAGLAATQHQFDGARWEEGRHIYLSAQLTAGDETILHMKRRSKRLASGHFIYIAVLLEILLFLEECAKASY